MLQHPTLAITHRHEPLLEFEKQLLGSRVHTMLDGVVRQGLCRPDSSTQSERRVAKATQPEEIARCILSTRPLNDRWGGPFRLVPITILRFD